ncbi:MAG: chorismate synthase, partial [Lentisphaeria bacterium]|nr:chorismate synthase [Lentisphaeria bacterium]
PGRHDPCLVPRMVPVVEAMTAIVLADLLLLSKNSRLG